MKTYCCLLLGLLFVWPAWTDDRAEILERGLDKFVAREPERKKWRSLSIEDLAAAARRGEAGAQEYLGLLYYLGGGKIERDFVEAVKWYRAAAAQNLPLGQTQLGSMYSSGLGVELNWQEAERWWIKAAGQGHNEALLLLGRRCETLAEQGYDARSNLTHAAKWFMQAATNGSPEGSFRLGELCLSGALPGRQAEAGQWHRRAAEQGHVDALARLARSATGEERLKLLLTAAERGSLPAQWQVAQMYDRGQGVPASPREAARWYLAALRQGVNGGDAAYAMFNEAVRLATGRGKPKDETRAVMYFRALAEIGLTKGQSALGYMLALRPPSEQTDAEAWHWLELATALNTYDNEFARANCGYMLATGRGVKQDHAEAVKWFQAVIPRDPHDRTRDQIWPVSAEVNLGICLFNGWGGPRDEARALKHFREAAVRGDAQGQSNLGLCLLHGRGLEADDYEAFMWLGLAADQGEAGAAKWRDQAGAKLSEPQREEARRRAAKLVTEPVRFPDDYQLGAANHDHTWNSGLRLPNIVIETKP